MFICLVFPCTTSAEINKDLRLKLGSTAGFDEMKLGSLKDEGSDKVRGNVQIETVFSPHWQSFGGFVVGIGIFRRQHSGKMDDLGLETNVDYRVSGVSVAPGYRMKHSDRFHFEGKLELGYGKAGEGTLSTPGVSWNTTKEGRYESVTMIAGWYYSFRRPGCQLGLEVGMQDVQGNFAIMNNNGQWTGIQATGTNGAANLIAGIRF